MRFEKMLTLGQLYQAWKDFSAGKEKKTDIMRFAINVEDELLSLLYDLQSGEYRHAAYERFVVHDPRRRVIHKASVRDRVVHRLVYNELLPELHARWLDCSFSCRPGFGQRRSIAAAQKGLRQATQNWSRECWVLKLDVKKFFDSVDHDVLRKLLFRHVADPSIQWLLTVIIESFSTCAGKGLSIGNLTSQLFANVYLHELDWFAKHGLKQRWYYRYADDILFLCDSHEEADGILDHVRLFLLDRLCLTLHPGKIHQRKSTWGIDWLGRVLLPGYAVLRPTTRRRIIKRVERSVLLDDIDGVRRSVASYNGLLIGTARRALDQKLLQDIALLRGT